MRDTSSVIVNTGHTVAKLSFSNERHVNRYAATCMRIKNRDKRGNKSHSSRISTLCAFENNFYMFIHDGKYRYNRYTTRERCVNKKFCYANQSLLIRSSHRMQYIKRLKSREDQLYQPLIMKRHLTINIYERERNSKIAKKRNSVSQFSGDPQSQGRSAFQFSGVHRVTRCRADAAHRNTALLKLITPINNNNKRRAAAHSGMRLVS